MALTSELPVPQLTWAQIEAFYMQATCKAHNLGNNTLSNGLNHFCDAFSHHHVRLA